MFVEVDRLEVRIVKFMLDFIKMKKVEDLKFEFDVTRAIGE